MKKLQIISKSGVITLWVLCLLYQPAQAQTPDPCTGIWEGTFMNDFKTAILLDVGKDGGYAGKILMFSGENRIQDDEITNINIENRTVTFDITAKESSFRGTCNEELTELSGKFIFPDHSEHPLVVRKVEKGDLDPSAASPSKESQFRKMIPLDELKSDLQHLIESLKEYHPRLYSYTSEEAFNRKVSETFAGLDRDMTLEEFYLEIAPLVALVQCSHTGIRLPGEYRGYITASGNLFPLEVFIQGERLFSLTGAGPQAPGLLPGTEILSVNQIPVNQIIDELLSVIPAEGGCLTTRYNELNRNFQTYFFLVDHSESYEIQFSTSSGPQFTLLEANKGDSQNGGVFHAPSLLPVHFRLEKDPVMGVLQVESFGIGNMEGYFTLLDTAFQMLEKENIQNLVLDLRNNSGGHPIFAAQLLSYLTDHEFTYFQRNPEVTDFEPLYNPMQANPHHYNGNVYVFVNGGCLSTTGHLISLLKHHTNAIFIGEEPGSTFSCNDFSIQVELPHTGMEMNIPRTTFVTDVSGFSEGETFEPDIEVRQTVMDQIEGVDPYMPVVYGIVVENRSNP